MNFDIGEIPKGWKKGQALIISQAVPPNRVGGLHYIGYLMLDCSKLPVADFAGCIDDVAAVTFDYTMCPKVDAWIKWWNE